MAGMRLTGRTSFQGRLVETAAYLRNVVAVVLLHDDHRLIVQDGVCSGKGGGGVV
jgi:hypothetical protein